MKIALLTAALVALSGCASTPPPADAGQKTAADTCGQPPVRTLKSSLSPRTVVYRDCAARARSDEAAREEPQQ